MRVTRETLIRIAKETAQKQAFSNPGLAAAYLSGSLRTDNPFLGGATDIDIVFVHEKMPKVRREIVALTPEVHLDIIHNPRTDYDKPKELRIHPWLGPELYDPLPLLVNGHFFEFIQAGVRDKYNEPESILKRAGGAAQQARQMWGGLQTSQVDGPALLLAYLKSVSCAANAVALLMNGNLLAERRFLLQFPRRAEAAGKPELAAALFHLLGADEADAEALKACLAAWERDFVAAVGRPRADARLALPRLAYYKLACDSLLASESPQTILWPLILTWTMAAQCLPSTQQAAWSSACRGLGLVGPGFKEKAAGLDHFLDSIEEMIENAPG
jgi:hypothetical protein